MATNPTPLATDQQFQYIKLPDGSYGKFRAEATDDQIRTAITGDFPDAFKPADQSFLDRAATQPSKFSHLNPLRYADELGQGMAQGVQAIAHPIDTAEKIGTGLRRGTIFDRQADQHAAEDRAAEDEPLGKQIGEIGDTLAQGYGQMATGAAAGKIAGAGIDAAPSVIRATGRVLGHPVAAPVIGAAADIATGGHGITGAIAGRMVRGGLKSGLSRMANFGLNGMPEAQISDGLPEVEAARPATEENLGKVVADDKAMRSDALAKVPRSQGTPEVAEHQPIATDFLHRELSDMAGRQGEQPEGLAEVEAHQPIATQHLQNAIAPKPDVAPLPPIKPAKVGKLLNESLGGKPLEPNVSLKNQSNITPTPVTAAPKESSVVKGHSYDPDAQELTVKTANGGEYIHGDVSPEQAKAFQQADSKGKAWNDIRQNSTLVAKVVNGKRVAVQPPKAARMASPDDLTPILNDSLAQVKAKQK